MSYVTLAKWQLCQLTGRRTKRRIPNEGKTDMTSPAAGAPDVEIPEHIYRRRWIILGALNLALAFVAGLALITRHHLVARAAGGAALVYGVPHLLYHLLNLGPFDAGDAVAMIVSLALAVAAGVAALAGSFSGDAVRPTASSPPGPPG